MGVRRRAERVKMEGFMEPSLLTRTSWTDYRWKLIDADAQSPAMHMAIDEVLTTRVGKGLRAPTIRFWEWQERTVVIGRSQSVMNEIDPEALVRHGMQLMRRISGGGTMFIVPENTITYSIYAPEALVAGMSFVDSYAFLDGWVVDSLRQMGVDARYVPINDIASPRGKIAGAAQSRRDHAVLHHTTMAYDIDNGAMREVLRLGRPRLAARGTPSANKHVDPLRNHLALPRAEVARRMVETFAGRYGLQADALTADELSEARRLAETKYPSAEWVHAVP